ncbi:MAG TPA: G-D-S-L family lipolytic protein, partial [Flavobacterium sp.]|nr:G-D-S-L family lipolytic protein [Flavobacterium sp.]
NANQVAALNANFGMYNAGLQQMQTLGMLSADEVARRTITFHEGEGNAVTIVDESLTDLNGLGLPSYRLATANDLIVLPAMSFIGTTVGGNENLVNGVSVPLEDQWVLIPSEISMISEATLSFNTSIKNIAQSKGLAVVDMNAVMNQLVSGLRVEDGQIYTANYFSLQTVGTVVFSLDGIHPNARGYALVANEIIKAINSHYNAKLPLVNAGNYPGATILPSN